MGLQGSQLVLLAQAETSGTTANMVLTGQPFRITRDWSEQSVRLVPDPAQWTCLGARRDNRSYGCAEIADVLKDVNLDLILILFPLKIVPMIPTSPVSVPHKKTFGKCVAPSSRLSGAPYTAPLSCQVKRRMVWGVNMSQSIM